MKFPFVSRTAYDLALGQLAITRKDLADSVERVDELIQTLTSLRRYGFDPERPTPTDDVPIPVDDLPDIIQDVIEELAIPGEPLHRDLSRQAYRELRKNDDPEAVAAIISEGADLEGF